MPETRFAREGDYLTVYIPPTNSALVFWVKSVANKGYSSIDYGPLPIAAGTALPTLDGGSATVPEDGVLPARAYTATGTQFPSPVPNVHTSSDMWYLPEDARDRLFHVLQRVTPAWLRVDVQVPTGVTQARFQAGRATLGVDRDFGFSRGCVEVVHIPKLSYGYRYANETNLDVRTFVRFEYAEYVVEVPRNPRLVFEILTRRVPSLWVSLPVSVMDPAVERALDDVYGFRGFRVYREDETQKAIKEYEEALKRVKLGGES